MQTSIDLQPPFSYSIIPIIIVLVVLLILTIYFVIKTLIKHHKQIPKMPKIKKVNSLNIKSIQQKYIDKLNKIKYNLDSDKISLRIAYQELSMVIRLFVYEVTNIKVQNYTLKDIEQLNMPILYELIQEYYVPEFAEHSIGDIKSSIEKTRKVIERWK